MDLWTYIDVRRGGKKGGRECSDLYVTHGLTPLEHLLGDQELLFQLLTSSVQKSVEEKRERQR
jgi:hypothetical protein